MYYANCEYYVDMGEHNKPLCERRSLRPAQCSECPVYIRRIEEENAKLREERNHWKVEQTHAYSNWEDAYKRASELATENAKLRNLVTEMHSFITSLPSSVRDYDNPLGNWEYTMQELGIEMTA